MKMPKNKNNEQRQQTNTEFSASYTTGGVGNFYGVSSVKSRLRSQFLPRKPRGNLLPQATFDVNSMCKVGNKTGEVYARKVNCGPCGGCCEDRVRWLTLRGGCACLLDLLFSLFRRLGLKVKYCDIVNAPGFHEVFCLRCREVEVECSGLALPKERERILSRDKVFKTSYLNQRIREAGTLAQVREYMRLAFESELFASTGMPVAPGLVDRTIKELLSEFKVFRSELELALVLWYAIGSDKKLLSNVMPGLLSPYTVKTKRRYGGWTDVLEVECVLCRLSDKHILFDTTVGFTAFVKSLLTHLVYDHGIRDWRLLPLVSFMVKNAGATAQSPVEGGGQGAESPAGGKLTNALIDVLVTVGLIEVDGGVYRCRLDGLAFSYKEGIAEHLLRDHVDLARDVKMVIDTLMGTACGSSSESKNTASVTAARGGSNRSEATSALSVGRDLLADLASDTELDEQVIRSFLDWLFNEELVKHWSIGLHALVEDALKSGHAGPVELRRRLGIQSHSDVKENINDPKYFSLLSTVRKIANYLAKAGLLDYAEDVDVINCRKCTGSTNSN